MPQISPSWPLTSLKVYRLDRLYTKEHNRGILLTKTAHAKRNRGCGSAFFLSLYGAVPVSWYLPSANLPATVFAIFPVRRHLGSWLLLLKKMFDYRIAIKIDYIFSIVYEEYLKIVYETKIIWRHKPGRQTQHFTGI